MFMSRFIWTDYFHTTPVTGFKQHYLSSSQKGGGYSGYGEVSLLRKVIAMTDFQCLPTSMYLERQPHYSVGWWATGVGIGKRSL